MLDPKLYRSDLQATAAQLQRRQFNLDIEAIAALEDQRKALSIQTQDLQNERNTKSKAIGLAKARGEDMQVAIAAMKQVSEELKQTESELDAVNQQLQAIFLSVPNIPHASVPVGADEQDNVEQKRCGELPQFDFTVRDHIALGEALGMMDFDLAAKITGSRFVVLKKDLVKLHRALIHFMIDTHVNQHDYEEVYVPYIVNQASLLGTGQLPKFAEDLFALHGEQPYYLTSTGEVPVTNIARDVIYEPEQLPIKYVSHTPCFRSEAGSYGRDTRGMIRQHQFEKVELVQLVNANESYAALEALTCHAEAILEQLGLAYRRMVLCTGDMGFTASKTYDLEVWLPGQNCYREISSCSNTESFQARRLQARVRNADTGKPELIHTLNGSGLAVGRTLIAIMENYQQADGSIIIPDVLQPYMQQTCIKA